MQSAYYTVQKFISTEVTRKLQFRRLSKYGNSPLNIGFLSSYMNKETAIQSQIQDSATATLQNFNSTVPVTVTVNHVTPVLPRHQIHLNGNRCNSSSTKAGVLVAIFDHGLTPPIDGTYYHCRG
ncbi:hypothetical protein AVEN_70600-1 [Araneus ventricosus]|uniref:Uncharacterized protein n=1 Tax=Araneus ventricosus TaxID=182803 RepID=A0A4Y2CFJ0_ARAVE|nr:hypothetical protein AVEN_70600-1 [Araneus ventricosus]